MSETANIFDGLPAELSQELIQTLLARGPLRIERIISLGHASPDGFWYDQDSHEWVVLLKGGARLQFEGEAPIDLRPGDYVEIPAHQRHRVDWTDPSTPTVWLAVHYALPSQAASIAAKGAGSASR